MNPNERELILKEEVYQIVGAAMEVSNELGAGFLEAVYQEALGIELKSRALPFVAQPAIRIAYKGRLLSKEYIPDFICYDQVIVEIKAIKGLTNIEQAQLLNYLKATGKPVGLLLNFGTPKLEWKRMVFNQPTIRVHSRSFVVKEGGKP
jgi:GxxExxY protein